jgi:hypothetical protein
VTRGWLVKTRNVTAAFLTIGLVIVVVGHFITKDMRNAAMRFVDAARAGDVATAYDMTTVQFRETTSRQQLAELFAAWPELTESTDARFFGFGFCEDDQMALRGTLESPVGESQILLGLRKSPTGWLVRHVSKTELAVCP